MSSSTVPPPLEGKVAVITGGSRGLGREMALAFARSGADVVVASRRAESCEATAEFIRAETGRRVMAYGLHVGHWESLETFVADVYDEFGQIDVLVNNAGMSPPYSSLADVSKELFDKVVDVNLKGPYRMSALCGQRMVDAGRPGSIINISSIASVRPSTIELPYAAAKAGLNALTVGFAQALGPTVRVNTIMAGPFLTDVSKAWDPEVLDEHMKALPLERAGKPSEIVGAALYLASDAASYTTGATIAVDGGRSIMA